MELRNKTTGGHWFYGNLNMFCLISQSDMAWDQNMEQKSERVSKMGKESFRKRKSNAEEK